MTHHEPDNETVPGYLQRDYALLQAGVTFRLSPRVPRLKRWLSITGQLKWGPLLMSLLLLGGAGTFAYSNDIEFLSARWRHNHVLSAITPVGALLLILGLLSSAVRGKLQRDLAAELADVPAGECPTPPASVELRLDLEGLKLIRGSTSVSVTWHALSKTRTLQFVSSPTRGVSITLHSTSTDGPAAFDLIDTSGKHIQLSLPIYPEEELTSVCRLISNALALQRLRASRSSHENHPISIPTLHGHSETAYHYIHGPDTIVDSLLDEPTGALRKIHRVSTPEVKCAQYTLNTLTAAIPWMCVQCGDVPRVVDYPIDYRPGGANSQRGMVRGGSEDLLVAVVKVVVRQVADMFKDLERAKHLPLPRCEQHSTLKAWLTLSDETACSVELSLPLDSSFGKRLEELNRM